MIRLRLKRLEARRMAGDRETDIHKLTDAELLALAGLPADATDAHLAEVASRGRPPQPVKSRKPN